MAKRIATTTIDDAELAQLKADARLTRTIRRCIKHGAGPTQTQQLQAINLILDPVVQADRDPLRIAWAKAVTSSGPTARRRLR